jgi:hypothetical protein
MTSLTMCDLLCDSNTVYSVAPRNKTTPSNGTRVESDRSVIVVAARMDALALFGQVKVGFHSPSTGLDTLLATAEVVAQSHRAGHVDDESADGTGGRAAARASSPSRGRRWRPASSRPAAASC